jgi:hypothetical protein
MLQFVREISIRLVSAQQKAGRIFTHKAQQLIMNDSKFFVEETMAEYFITIIYPKCLMDIWPY